MGHGVLRSSLICSCLLLLNVFELVQVAELIALTMIGKTLAIYFCQLVVVAVDFNFLGHKILKPIVMTLHNQAFNPPIVVIIYLSTMHVLAHLAVDEIVVAIGKNAGDSDAHLNCDLVIMSINRQTLHSILLGDLNARIVLVQRQVHVLHRRRMVAMLWWSSLVLILRHCELLSCSSRRLLALVSLIAGLHLMSSNQLVEIHEVLELGNTLE